MADNNLIPMVFIDQREGEEWMFFMAPEFEKLPVVERESVLDQLDVYLKRLRSEVDNEKRRRGIP